MKKSCWFLSLYTKKYKYYLVDFYTRFFKVFVFSNSKFALSKYRYKKFHSHYFISSVRSTSYGYLFDSNSY